MDLNGWYFDIESDNLYLMSSRIWYIRLKTFDGSRSIKVHPFKEDKEIVKVKLLEWINSFDDEAYVSGHNQLGFDIWMLWKFFDIKPRVGKDGGIDTLGGKKVIFIDTLVLSQYLMPNLPSHSLDSLASGSENEKMKYRDKLVELGVMKGNEPKGFEFSFYHPLMDQYCDEDVDAGIGVLKRLWTKAIEMYKDKWLHPSFRQMSRDYFLYSAQAYTGVKFNQEKAKALVAHVEECMEVIKREVDPELPPRPLKTAEQAFYKIPAKPYMKSGELSAAMAKWLEKHNAQLINEEIHAYGKVAPLVANEIFPMTMPMEIEDSKELKQYFMDNGWVAADDFWNFKKGPDGKPIRDENNKFIRTSPKIQHQGNLCPNLLKLNGVIPAKVVKFLSYRNRKGVVEGWLNNWRLPFDGRLSAEISGYAPTSRVKHRVVVNCPKADVKVLLGAEMRDLFYVDKNFWYCNTDAAALENRTLSSYTFKYDGGKFARMQTEGDPHSFNAFAFFPHIKKQFDPDNPENKEDPLFKPWRNKAKTGAYLLAFGGGAPKLASSLGLSKKEGQTSYDNYWAMNEGLGLLKKAVEKYFDTTGQKKYVPAIDGRIVSVRGKNVLLSCLGQGCGAISMSYAACLMDDWLGEMELDDKFRPYYLYKGKVVKRVSMVHKLHCAF